MRRTFTGLAVSALLLLTAARTAADDLAIDAGDVRIETGADGGFDLYVRAKPGLGSILLTESTKDPAGKADNFAYRAAEYNPVNGDEKRMLNGKLISASSRIYSLVSSTPLPDEKFGTAFRIYVPPVLHYGYPWSRSGTVAVGKGTFLNIRAFAKPYADYAGPFRDNPYQMSITVEPPPVVDEQPAPPEEPPTDDSTSAKFGSLLGEAKGTLDLVICLDTTESMSPYIDDIKKGLGPILERRTAGFSSYRLGIVLYRDYWPDEYITRRFPYTSEIPKLMGIVNAVRTDGGRDLPEALNEALYSAATDFDWTADRRQIIFLTDAAPHVAPKGKIDYSDVLRETGKRGIEIDAIIEPPVIPPPKQSRTGFDNVRKRLAALKTAPGADRPRLLVLVAGPDGAKRADEVKAKLLAPLGTAGGPDVSGPREFAPREGAPASPGPWYAAIDGDAIGAAKAEGAALVLLISTLAPPASSRSASAMSLTVSRLLDAATGKELERDVLWRVGLPSGEEALFPNGFREK